MTQQEARYNVLSINRCVETSHNRIRILWIPNHLWARGWLAAHICMISRPVPGEDLENNQHSHTTNLILGLVFFIRLLIVRVRRRISLKLSLRDLSI